MMRNALVCLALCLSVSAAAVSMSRVLGIRDSRTLLVDTNGTTSVVTLRNVDVAADEEPPAAEYLRRTVANHWVYVEHGDVYRSPDGLYVNADMNRHPWRTMKYLGELDLGVRAKGQPAGNKVVAPVLPPMQQRPSPAARRVTSRARPKR